jgi:hypothetical protein
MAIDTKERRLSVMALDAAGTGIHTLPDPTGTFDGGDRQHFLDCYSGIAFGAPGGPPPDDLATKYLLVGDGVMMVSGG